jgi:SNF2 family DNA or RNA helicase
MVTDLVVRDSFDLTEKLELFPYQQEDVERIISKLELGDSWGMMNLSEMGTGKTPVAIRVAERLSQVRTLVICPNSLKWEWHRQIEMWTGKPPAVARKGCYRRLETLFERDGQERSDWFVINYESFRKKDHRDILELYPFDFVIMDEAHRIRRAKTKQTRGILEFCEVKRAGKRKVNFLLMTGSPIVNNPSDLFTLLCIADPERYKIKDKYPFLDRYCYYGTNRHGDVYVTGTKNMLDLRERTRDIVVRRTKKEVLPYLPDKYYRRVMLEMDVEQRDLYTRLEKELKILLDSGEPLYAMSVLSKLLRLRQINLDPNILGVGVEGAKTRFVLDLIDELADDGQKLVIFTCFREYAEYLDRIIDPKIQRVMFTGKTEAEVERPRNIKMFQEDPSVKLCIGTVQTMGEGLTLTAASNVVLVDRWWTPSVMHQAEDRLSRIGQKNAVQVIIPIIRDSIDELFDRILKRKERLAEAFLGKDEITFESEETGTDLLRILREGGLTDESRNSEGTEGPEDRNLHDGTSPEDYYAGLLRQGGEPPSN